MGVFLRVGNEIAVVPKRPAMQSPADTYVTSSGRRDEHSCSDAKDTFLALMDAEGFDRVNLLGHEWGGYTSFLLALEHPERISARSRSMSPDRGWVTCERATLRRRCWAPVGVSGSSDR
jgi:pimeloyl-ACP methyl ester carboxylesterase